MSLQAPLTFFFRNKEARDTTQSNVLYKNHQNQVDLVIAAPNLTGNQTITLKAGQPVSDAGDPQGSVLWLYYLDEILQAAQLGQIQFDGWQCQHFNDDGEYLALSPKSNIVLTSSTNSHIVSGTISVGPGTGTNSTSVEVDYSNLQGISDNSYDFKVLVQNQPQAQKSLHDVLVCGFAEGSPLQVAVSLPNENLANTFEFFWRRKDNAPAQIQAGAHTKFTVSFVYSRKSGDPGYGALATAQKASSSGEFNLKLTEQTPSGWQSNPQKDGRNPSWELTLPSGQDIVGTGANAQTVFEFENAVSDVEAGLTEMYIQYENVPGYDDGFFTLPINKNPRVNIKKFAASPTAIYGPGGQVYLSWEVDNAESVNLNTAAGNQRTVEVGLSLIDVTGKNWREWSINNTTTFALEAQGSGTAVNRMMKHITVNVMTPPIIQAFQANPELSDYFPIDVMLSWDAENVTEVTLNNLHHSAKGNAKIRVNNYGENFTLTAHKGGVSIAEKFSILNQMYAIGEPVAWNVSQSLLIPFPDNSKVFYPICLDGISDYALGFMDTSSYSEHTVHVDSDLPNIVGVLADGSKAFAKCGHFPTPSHNQSLKVVDVQSYSIVESLPLGHASVCSGFASAPDSSKIAFYVSDDYYSDASTLYILQMGDYSQKTLALVNYVRYPFQLLFSPDSSRLFVLGSYSLAVINTQGYSISVEYHWEFSYAKPDSPLSPKFMALAPNRHKLLISDSSNSYVYLFDTSSLSWQKIPSPSTSDKILVSPDESHAFVRCYDSILVINMEDLTTKTIALDSSYQDQSLRGQLVISPNGKRLFLLKGGFSTDSFLAIDAENFKAIKSIDVDASYLLALSNDKLLAFSGAMVEFNGDYHLATHLIDVVEFKAGTSISVGQNPQGIALSPDGTRAIVANLGDNTIAAINVSSLSASSPISVGRQPQGVAFTPDGTKALVANSGDQTLSIVNLSDRTSKTINLPFAPSRVAAPSVGLLAFVVGENKMAVVDCNYPRLQYVVELGGSVKDIFVAPDLNRIFLLQTNPDTVVVLHYDENSFQYASETSLAVGPNPTGFAFLRNPNQLLVVNRDESSISVINLKDLSTPQKHSLSFLNQPAGIGVLPGDARIFVSNSGNNTVSVINATTFEVIDTINVGNNPGNLVATPDGKVLVVNENDSTVSVLISAS